MEKSFMFNFSSKSATSINHTFIQIQGAKKSNFFNATLLAPYSLNPHHSLTGIRTKLKLFKKNFAFTEIMSGYTAKYPRFATPKSKSFV